MFLYVIIMVFAIVITIQIIVIKNVTDFADRQLTEVDRYREYFSLYNHWFLLKQRNINISDYLYEHGYKKVIVYGMGALGLRLCDELKDSKVQITRTVDRSYNTIYYSDAEVYEPEVGLKNIYADAVIVTANVPKELIKSYMDSAEIEIINLREIINNM